MVTDYIERLDKGEKLLDWEIVDFVLRFGVEVDEQIMGRGDNIQYIKTIKEIDGRFFAIEWSRSAHNEYHNQPYEVMRHSLEITVNQWLPKSLSTEC